MTFYDKILVDKLPQFTENVIVKVDFSPWKESTGSGNNQIRT